MSKQSRQSRWGGAPLLPSSSSSVLPASTSIPPPAAASSLPEEATNNQQKMCDFSKNNSATAQRTSSSQQHEGHGDSQHQHHRRGYDMSHNDYYEKEEHRPRSSSTASGSGREEYYGRQYFERGRERGGGGGRPENPPSPRHQDDWICPECGVYNDPRDDCCRRCNCNYHRYEYDNRNGDDWRCLECGMYNHPRDDRCHRCHQLQYSSYENEASSSRPRKKNRRDDDREDRGGGGGGDGEHDQFKQLRDKFKQRQQREWPPSFDTDGASYIFDSRSGMFYHPPCDFFYDPKTKLYYGNKKAQYFHFVGAEDANAIPFLPVQAGGGGNGAAAEEGVVESSNPDSLDKKVPPPNPEQKPKIAISLKTKVANPPVKSLNEVAAFEKSKLNEQKKAARKDSAHLTTDTSPPVIPQSHKKHEEDMEKWSGRVKELRNDDEENTTNPSTSRKIKTTVSGQPICLLCRRKFASVEKLEQHEKLSALHKANLAKKTAADAEKASKQKEAEGLYKDRAKERRLMHGDLTSAHSSGPSSRADAILAQADGSRASAISATKTAEIVRPEDTLGDTNVGNKLLQKLGWKSGDTLGRKQDGENDAQPKGGKDAASSLKSDWERIESLAQGGGHRSR